MRIPAKAALAFTVMIATSASAATIPLRAGDYGATGMACDNQPNATTMSFDGRSFSYPHASRCTDTITSRTARVLTISETCRAAGDGSPATASTQTFRLRPDGRRRFTMIKGDQRATFQRCGALGYFNRH